MKKHNFYLSEDLTLKDIRNLYDNVVLKQEFYGDDYGEDWHAQPFRDLSEILVNIFECQMHMDIGCGKGLLVEAMRKRGLNLSGSISVKF